MLMHLLRVRLLSKVASETHSPILKATYQFFPESCMCATWIKKIKSALGFYAFF